VYPFLITSSALAQRSNAGCAIMIMFKVSTSARRSNPTYSLITPSCPGLRTRIIAGRHKVDQTLIDNTVTVKERHVPLQS
jgi:hypothetical protein